MRALDGMRIMGPADGESSDGARSERRELIWPIDERVPGKRYGS